MPAVALCENRVSPLVTHKNERPMADHGLALKLCDIVDFPKLSGEPWANQETLAKVTALDTVIVSFESDEHPKKIMILLEKESGKFISSRLIPRNSK
jgi:hypothetical protein